MISVIDYGAGNLASVYSALAHLGYSAEVVSERRNISPHTSTIILPGVGDGSFMMSQLQARDFTLFLQQWAEEDRPLLGICVGAQVLLSFTEEGDASCLNVIDGRCKSFTHAFDAQGAQNAQDATHERLKIPHMGWNQIPHAKGIPLFHDVSPDATMYFVHSYYLSVTQETHTLAHTHYGLSFSSVIGKGNVIGTQFHPEKSGTQGLRIIDNFLIYYGKEE